jgi:hypothetical protein
MKEFKLRASKGGVMLPNGKNAYKLGVGAITYIEEWVISQFTGKKKDITSKYLQRGIDVEHKAIERAARHFNCELVKNEVYLENDYFCGTFDTLFEYKMVIDVKSSWDCFTFPYFMSEPPKDYVAQLQIYMELLGVKKAALVYCLENGTDEQIERKAWELSKKAGKDEMDMDDWNEAEALLNYDHLPEKNRIKVFEFDYDAEMIATLQDRVVAARDYIKNELIVQL